MSAPTTLPISPAQAAHIAKVSRRSIMRAIETQELQAFRDNRNRWKINPADLDKWAGAQWAHSGHAHIETPTLPTSENPEIMTRLTAAESRADLLASQLDDTRADRDHWRDMAQKLADQPRGWWPWTRRKRHDHRE